MTGEARLAGRLAPAAMYPAGVPSLQARWVTLPDGLRVRVVESGGAAQPVVLLLHGWGASLYMWRDWFAPLAAAGYRAIAIDLPGHGLSDKPADPEAYRIESMVSAVREFIAAEAFQRLDVIAQSMAGTITVELALAPGSPIRRATLVNPACFGRVRMQRLVRLLSPPAVDVILPRLVARWLVARTHRMVYGDPRRLTRQDEDEYWAPSQFPAYARAMRRLLHEFHWERAPAEQMAARLRALREPLQVILGSRDFLVRDSLPYVEALRAAGAPVQVSMIDGAGHAVNEERPEDTVPLVLSFLSARA